MKEHLLIKKWENILQAPILEIKPYRKHWSVRTPYQRWIVKKTDISWLRWWEQIDRELRERGFHYMLPFYHDMH
jgi:hypothetical protein